MNKDNQHVGSRGLKSIDFMLLYHTLLKYKKLFAKVLGIAFVLGCIYAFSMP
jgi:uncharacterized protein involved in exopolysaccharide biosynthesis